MEEKHKSAFTRVSTRSGGSTTHGLHSPDPATRRQWRRHPATVSMHWKDLGLDLLQSLCCTTLCSREGLEYFTWTPSVHTREDAAVAWSTIVVGTMTPFRNGTSMLGTALTSSQPRSASAPDGNCEPQFWHFISCAQQRAVHTTPIIVPGRLGDRCLELGSSRRRERSPAGDFRSRGRYGQQSELSWDIRSCRAFEDGRGAVWV